MPACFLCHKKYSQESSLEIIYDPECKQRCLLSRFAKKNTWDFLEQNMRTICTHLKTTDQSTDRLKITN